ncbi:MAG: cytochrome c maturation protein CcmE [Calditrichaeota bacterium]|nr:MAG: cytochrome c maturation protein CcmE [Calditrichota bacterium]
MNSKKIKIAFSFTVVVGLVVWLVVSGFNDNMRYYVGVKEVKAMSSDAYGKGLRVRGQLVPGSLVRKSKSLEVSFLIEDQGEQLEVHYAKELPDTFKDGAEVLVEGKYTPEGYFDAQMLMAKCPSKYESTDDYSGGGQPAPYSKEGTN